MLARAAVGPAACPELKLSKLEMLLEFVPFTLGWFTVFGFGSCRASRIEESSIGADESVVEDGGVALCGVDVLVPQYLCGDMYGEPARDGFGGEQAPCLRSGRVRLWSCWV